MNINIRLDGLKDAMKAFDPKVANRAVNSALKKIAAQAKTEASGVIRERYAIKKADLDRKIAVRPPIRTGEMTVELSLTSRPISLSYFGAQQVMGNRVLSRKGKALVSKTLKRASSLPAGVRYQILKSGGKQFRKNAMMARMKSGHIGVFRFTGKPMASNPKRKAIAEVAMVTPSTLFGSKRTVDAINRLVQAKFNGILRHELDYFMRGGAK